MTAAIKLIHVGAKALGLDEDTRRELQFRITGKASLRDMTPTEQTAVLDALKAQGFTPSAGKKPHRKPAPRGDVRYLHVLWRLLADAKVVDKKGAKGLNAFIRARFEASWGAVPLDVDQMNDHAQIAAVAEALKAMCRRAQISVTR